MKSWAIAEDEWRSSKFGLDLRRVLTVQLPSGTGHPRLEEKLLKSSRAERSEAA